MALDVFALALGLSSSKSSEICFFTKVFGFKSFGCRSSKPGPRFSFNLDVAEFAS
jgi:hypothetical protein